MILKRKNREVNINEEKKNNLSIKKNKLQQYDLSLQNKLRRKVSRKKKNQSPIRHNQREEIRKMSVNNQQSI